MKVILLVDVSKSMEPVRSKAYGLVDSISESFEHIDTYSFSNEVVPIPKFVGTKLSQAIDASQPHYLKNTKWAIEAVRRHPHDLLVVITNEPPEQLPQTIWIDLTM